MIEKTTGRVFTSQSDLDPKDHPLLEMYEWCQRQGDIIVLQSGLILASNIQSRSVQNCKTILLQKGLRASKVVAASQGLIDILMADAEAAINTQSQQVRAVVSAQQQRLRTLIKEALDVQASDIHIEVRQDIARIRFRKHGELYLHAEWHPLLAREIASVAFNKETDHAITHFNPSIPQNASMPLSVGDTEVRLRLAGMPAHGGFDVVLRVLATGTEATLPLSALGYQPDQIAIIEKAVAMPHGAVIVSGPTGSGKTTTLASCMTLVDHHRKIFTIEDPVEKLIPQASQVPVNTEKGDRDFASMGRTVLRMDPDVMVLGEMRDEDTVRVMVRAAITGHLVFSTLHTNTAPAIITRLIDMGVSPVLLGDPNLLVCLICQRLVPVLCEVCATPVLESALYKNHIGRWHTVFGDNMSQLRARGRQCSACKNLGIRGRTVAAEIIWIDDKGRRFIQQGDTLSWEIYLREQGWRSYRDHAWELVRKGIADPLDVEKLTGPISNVFTESQFYYHAIKT